MVHCLFKVEFARLIKSRPFRDIVNGNHDSVSVSSFSYEGKKTKNIGLTCRCRLIITMNYSVYFMKA